jgi:histone H3/H4
MNNAPDRPQFDFQEVIDRASRRLQNAAQVPFSDQAFQQLKEQISAYAEELIDESVKKAKQHRAESVSSADVQQAGQFLVARPSTGFTSTLELLVGYCLALPFQALFP